MPENRYLLISLLSELLSYKHYAVAKKRSLMDGVNDGGRGFPHRAYYCVCIQPHLAKTTNLKRMSLATPVTRPLPPTFL